MGRQKAAQAQEKTLRKNGLLTTQPPIKDFVYVCVRLFVFPDSVTSVCEKRGEDRECSRWAMDFALRLRELCWGLTGEWCSKSVLEEGEQELAAQAAFLLHTHRWFWVSNPGSTEVVLGPQISK